jgi:hypothetical protein
MMHGEAAVPVSRTRATEQLESHVSLGKLDSHLGIQEMFSLRSVT